MDRKENILQILQSSSKPVTGNEMAKILGVSRQVVVQDVAILRAQGIHIMATPQGYLLINHGAENSKRAVLAVKHMPEETEEELNILVDHNIRIIDVIIDHQIYGELRGFLMLNTRADVKKFIENIKAEKATLLSSLTGGVHLHTVEYEDDLNLQKAKEKLSQYNFLAKS
ncbi:Helix-turn-helix type 11 domain protein [Desulfofarcimen acetoxidans DSM 771]|uniref:Helix-turn-helix type 11 domain protein n=1 Tax=Desulfofarcimen acetoxidans (strain ATCC 49208 / DSM 771 / KCTC 5769 / VKM B-1644 / 5575) TaxID=485916 RepID=C8VZU0_DESAS|nr:transcription repressor NadR [Desulfofarcimen acetoxidans]ACV63068.1 Helix-turn-helix type 11 domain protein [Desulfofarcimen acetoxidans DSM 771]